MKFEEQYKARNELIDQLKKEMLGPGSEPNTIDISHELISTNPETRYCLGILYPQDNKLNMESDDSVGIDSDDKEELLGEEEQFKLVSNDDEDKKVRNHADMEDSMDETVGMATKLLPSSMGITFITDKKIDSLNVKIKFGTYKRAILSDCKIRLDDSVVENFAIPEVFSGFFSFDKETKELKLVEKFDKKQIKYWYEQDKADDGAFKPYAYKMLGLLSNGYVREPHEFDECISFADGDYYKPMTNLGDTNAKINALRYDLGNGYFSYTIMLLNSLSGKHSGPRSIFQPEIIISSDNNDGLKFCDYSVIGGNRVFDEEEASNALLYRNKKNYGAGLGTAVNWQIDENGEGFICSDFFPRVDVPQMEFKVDEKYNVDGSSLSMKYLSDLDETEKDKKVKTLESLVEAYGEWIAALEEEATRLSAQYTETAKRHIDNCKLCLNRMREGIAILEKNDKAWDAFQLANRAMYMQRVHILIQKEFDTVYPDVAPECDRLADILDELNYYNYNSKAPIEWRPFQIAFLLMSITSMVNDQEENSDRDVVDLIWFPTGGGKTEAYLGLTAFTIFYRKLVHLDESDGTTVIMRYTLRLLAAQQFTRAATLICACEYIRRDCCERRPKYPKYALGNTEISIGLWIGGEHTPNRIKGNSSTKSGTAKECYEALSEAYAKNLTYVSERYNKFQLLKCPWCGTKLVKGLSTDGKKMIGRWGYHLLKDKEFFISCTNENCTFERKLPVQVVDEELYKNPPTLLFATVDKFAMLPWYAEVGNFFAINSNNRGPELIIQDELHLISGPLGSMVGLYETVMDYLCSNKGVRPKIIASTATICRAKEQCSSLYNRKVFQFPPQGLDESDSFFARSADLSEKFGRTYVGLLPAGKTKARAEGRILASLMQIEQEYQAPDEIKDCYWTVTAYFNSLKELGKCSTIIQDDVRDDIRRLADRNMFIYGRRNILRPDELTSRVSTTELNQTLEKLEKIQYSSNKEEKKHPSNILLATNMISVGIDVDRLNVMLMVGQPKLTSEYIQASSRVGRTFPGVVFTMYDGVRSRDRSHYEQFKAYHESFYKYVEPTGVTPFSEPARKRALHAVAISMLRHGMGLSTDADISQFDADALKDELKEISDYIVTRMEDINSRLTYQVKSEKDDVEDELDVIYEKIGILAETSDHSLEYGNIAGFKPRNEGSLRVMKPFGTDQEELITFDTLTSMRNVDSSVNVNVVVWEE